MVPYRSTNIIIINNNIMIRMLQPRIRRLYYSTDVHGCINIIIMYWKHTCKYMAKPGFKYNIYIFDLFGQTSSTLSGRCPVNKYVYFRFIRWKRRRIRFVKCEDDFFIQWLSSRKFDISRFDSLRMYRCAKKCI